MSCVARGRAPRPECAGPIQGHHVLPQRYLKRRHATLKAEARRGGPPVPWALGRAVKDPRIIVRLCWAHHQLVENARLYLTRADLPVGAFDAADEYGLLADFERLFPERGAEDLERRVRVEQEAVRRVLSTTEGGG